MCFTVTTAQNSLSCVASHLLFILNLYLTLLFPFALNLSLGLSLFLSLSYSIRKTADARSFAIGPILYIWPNPLDEPSGIKTALQNGVLNLNGTAESIDVHSSKQGRDHSPASHPFHRSPFN